MLAATVFKGRGHLTLPVVMLHEGETITVNVYKQPSGSRQTVTIRSKMTPV